MKKIMNIIYKDLDLHVTDLWCLVAVLVVSTMSYKQKGVLSMPRMM